MAPVEFEKELKKQLRSREARPSEDAWERIADRLDAEGPGRGLNPRWLTGLVAASIAILAALVFFWERPETHPATDQVVETPGKQGTVLESEKKNKPSDLVPESDREGIATTFEGEKPESSDSLAVSEPEVFQAAKEDGATASLEGLSPLEDGGRNVELIAADLDTIHAGLVAMESAEAVDSDAQIDSLLREAQQAIAGRDAPEKQPSVDPLLLLSEVEDELDQTFREQILEKLKTEYTRIRSSVADRNN